MASYFLSSILIPLYACKSKCVFGFFHGVTHIPIVPFLCFFKFFLISLTYLSRTFILNYKGILPHYHTLLFLPLNADSGDRTHALCLQGNHFTGLNFFGFLSFLGQHCLDPDAYILDVYHVNPHAEWVIKPSPSL